jgi:hypothetical protein
MTRLTQPRNEIGGIDLRAIAGGAIIVLTIVASTQAHAQRFAVLYHFTPSGSNSAPFQPYNGLAMTAGGNLYGATAAGGLGLWRRNIRNYSELGPGVEKRTTLAWPKAGSASRRQGCTILAFLEM